MSSCVRYCVVINHMFMRIGQDGCECCWILSGQIRFRPSDSGKHGVIVNCVPILMNSGYE